MDLEELEFEGLEELDLGLVLTPELIEGAAESLVFPPSVWEDFEDGFLGSLFSICLIISEIPKFPNRDPFLLETINVSTSRNPKPHTFVES